MLSQTDYLTGICQQPRALPTDPGQIQTSEPVQTPYQPRVYRPGWLQAGQRQVEAQAGGKNDILHGEGLVAESRIPQRGGKIT
jgi:hypothetical protein